MQSFPFLRLRQLTKCWLMEWLFVRKRSMRRSAKKEPLRCLKCQGWGHLARDCSAATDTCGTCAQRHRTTTCTNTARPHCVSCGIGGHASWDRGCPIFQHKCSEMNDRLEDNSLPYFPTKEAWTQVHAPPKVVFIAPPPPRASHVPPRSGAGPGLMQSKLPWQRAGLNLRGSPFPPQQEGWQDHNVRGNHVGFPPSSQPYV